MLAVRGSDWSYNFVRNTFNYRFGKRWEKNHLDIITRYFYLISINNSIGEYALNSLLDPIIVKQQQQDSFENRIRLFAYKPLVEELASNEKKIPILLLYGDNDWLSYSTVMDDMERLRLVFDIITVIVITVTIVTTLVITTATITTFIIVTIIIIVTNLIFIIILMLMYT